MLGGTGHIGAAIARALDNAGWRVIASGRTNRDRPNLENTAIRVVSGDDANRDTVTGWITKADLVVDAATPYPLWLHMPDRARIVTDAVARTDHLLQQAAKTGAEFVHVSSFTTLPRPTGGVGPMTHGLLQGLHTYFELKSKVEAAVLQALDSGLSGCVVNPSTCFGPYDLKPKEHGFIPMLLAGKVGGLARHDLNVIDVRDVADVVTAARNQGFPYRQIPVFGHNITLPDLARQVCRLGGVSAPRVQVPSLMGLAGLYWLETAFAITGRKSPWPSLPMLLLQASYAAATGPAQLALAGPPRALETTLSDAITWYRQIGHC